jgi:D-alanyl-D-alanine carboxypeptidase
MLIRVVALFLLVILVLTGRLWAEFNPLDNVRAGAALLFDVKSRRILYARNIHTPLPPASTTKIMTALVAYEANGGLGGNVRIERADTQVVPTYIPLMAGETVPFRTLLRCLLVSSSNDAALAVARHVGGSVPVFVEMMNKRAREMGCSRTRFMNPHGLPAEGQLTTASDLLIIFQHALRYAELREMMSTMGFYVQTRAGRRYMKNHNILLGRYYGMGPAKTGWTRSSRHTYAASATREGREIHLIILNSPDKWSDARELFDFGFFRTLGTSVPQLTSVYGGAVVEPVFGRKGSTTEMLAPNRPSIVQRQGERAVIP